MGKEVKLKESKYHQKIKIMQIPFKDYDKDFLLR